MGQRAHLGEELRRVLPGVGDFGTAGLESSGAEFLEFELAIVLTAVVLAVVFLAVVVGIIVAAVIVVGGSGGRAGAPYVALHPLTNVSWVCPRPSSSTACA